MRLVEFAKIHWIAVVLSAWAVLAFARSLPSYVNNTLKAFAVLVGT